MEKRWRRRNFFIKKELQGRYIFGIFVFVIIASFLFPLIFAFLSADTLSIAYKDHYLQLGKTPLILFKEILRAYWIFIVAGGLLIAFVSMFLSHRFAGPLFRFEKVVDEMIRGNFDYHIRLRSKDDAKELAEMINRFNDMISSNLKEMRDLSDKIDAHLTAGTGAAGDKGADSRQLVALNKRLREILYGFKLKNNE